jgi:hypothetical protein
MFDFDPEMAVQSRRNVYDMLVAEKMLVQGFHNPDNTCGGAATVSLFIQRLGDTGYGEFDRWFSKSSIILANGTGTLSTEVSPDKWISVYGRDGNAPVAAAGHACRWFRPDAARRSRERGKATGHDARYSPP